MQLCFYLFIFLHIAEGCIKNNVEVSITASSGGSAVLPCSCTDPQDKETSFIWRYRKKGTNNFNDIYPSDVTNRYSARVQRVNADTPGNFNISISSLTVEDEGDYQCQEKSRTNGYTTVHLSVKASPVLIKTTGSTTRPHGASTTTASRSPEPGTTSSSRSSNAGSKIISSSPHPHGGSITTTKPEAEIHEVFTGIIQYLYFLVPILLVLLLLLICVLCWTYRAQKKSKEQRSEEGQDSDGVTYAAVAWKGGKKPAEKAPKEHSDNDDVTYAAVTWKPGKTPAEKAPKEHSVSQNDEEVLYDGTKGNTVEKQNDEDVLYVSMKGNTLDRQACVSNDEDVLYVSMKRTTVDKQEDVTYSTVNK